MGGGNAQKSKTARERNQAKKQKEAKQKNRGETQKKMEKDKQAQICKICLTTFMNTAKRDVLMAHFNSKHASKGFSIQQCFPQLADA